jgi:hypothetical protein
MDKGNMSRTFSIACMQCRVHLWIAQSTCGGSLYHTPENIEALRKFLFDHVGHPLKFDDNCETDISEMTEIETHDEDI